MVPSERCLNRCAMSSIAFQIAAAFAILAISATGVVLFPAEGMKGLAKGMIATIALGVVAVVLIAVARALGS